MRFRLSWMILILAMVATGCTLESLARRRNPEPSYVQSAPATGALLAPATEKKVPAVPTSASLIINPENTAITFVGASLLNKQPGSFSRFDGRIELASNDPRDAQLSVQIDIDSVTTKIPLLTKHVKRADFLDVEHYPTATFVSSRVDAVERPDATHIITGDMTIHGVTRTLAVPARFTVSADLLILEASIAILQTEFGMEKSARKTEDLVPVTISSRLARR